MRKLLENTNTCDKCGKPVPRSNSALWLGMIIAGNYSMLLFNLDRHLLPVDGCEGSPSRAQYLLGMPKDTRGYKWDSEYGINVQKAYEVLQTL